MLRPGATTIQPAGLPTWALFGGPWAAALLAVLAALLLPGATVQTAARWTLLGSVLLFGLPHGAADWWVMGRAAGARWHLRTQAEAAGVYVLASLVALGFWRWQPGAALAGFLGLTAWHFGSADASVLLPGRRTFRDAVWWMFAVGRGLLVVFTPLAFRPVEAAGVLLPFTALGSGVPDSIGGLLRAALPLTWLGAALQVAAIRFDAGRDPDRTTRQRLTGNVLETALLLMLFRVAPPLTAFVAYWVGFHAWRHLLRLEWTGRGAAVERLPVSRMLWDFHRRTLALTLLSLLGLGLILLVWPALANGPHAVVVYLILLSVLTVPHAVVIGWLLDGQKAKGRSGDKNNSRGLELSRLAACAPSRRDEGE